MIDPFLRKHIFLFLAVAVLVGLAHILLIAKSLPPIYAETQTWTMYVLFVPLTITGLVGIYRNYTKDQTSVVKSFMFYTVVKIIALFVFLAPWIVEKTPSTKPFIIQFFILFFVFLVLEIRFLVQMLNNQGQKTEKN